MNDQCLLMNTYLTYCQYNTAWHLCMQWYWHQSNYCLVMRILFGCLVHFPQGLLIRSENQLWLNTPNTSYLHLPGSYMVVCVPRGMCRKKNIYANEKNCVGRHPSVYSLDTINMIKILPPSSSSPSSSPSSSRGFLLLQSCNDMLSKKPFTLASPATRWSCPNPPRHPYPAFPNELSLA